jgi:hypothetical protein
VLLDKEQAEVVPPMPAAPQRASLLEFEVRGHRGFRYYVDGATLAVDPKGVVRYTLVARSPSGSENVTFEAINCRSDEYRVYALGRADGSWGGRPGGWRPIAESRQPHYRTLQREYFCQRDAALSDADEVRRALQEGGNPWAKNFGTDWQRRQGR